MTQAQTILCSNLTDDNVVISEAELMADAADSCVNYTYQENAYGEAFACYYFDDGSKLVVEPSHAYAC